MLTVPNKNNLCTPMHEPNKIASPSYVAHDNSRGAMSVSQRKMRQMQHTSSSPTNNHYYNCDDYYDDYDNWAKRAGETTKSSNLTSAAFIHMTDSSR